MTAWLIRSTLQTLETGSPREMQAAFGGTGWTDANGNAQSNAVAVFQPNLSAVAGQPAKYWVLTGDAVSLMAPAQQATVDTAILAASRDASVATLTGNVEAIARAVLLVTIDEFNRHSTLEAALFSAIAQATSLANLQTRAAVIAQLPQRTAADLTTAIRNKLGS